ncbi:MAG: hypothetical protein HY360_23320 [Verrucomicrobia bacterium]|nr:hypothetical protein [Verrucomicrobiota bacterium]
MANLRAIPLYDHSAALCSQETLREARLYESSGWVGSAKRAPGYVHVRHPRLGLVAAIRWFYEEFPKGIRVSPQELALCVCPEYPGALGWRHDIPFVRIGRGEAKRQSVALWFLRRPIAAHDAEKFNACVQEPPRLFNRQWFLQSRVLETGAAAGAIVMCRWEKAAAKPIAATGLHFPRLGHREYWDTAWMNNYRSRARIGLIRYFETGNLQWRRYFDAACCHYRDVDTIHFCPEHPDRVHNGHAEGPDHTSRDAASSKSTATDDFLDHCFWPREIPDSANWRKNASNPCSAGPTKSKWTGCKLPAGC